ncbi:acyltransferase family protein [Rhodobacteraceae bacterium 2CG4]|uniref:Acyltransferase family protein n=1 Tax=Halovulum marinum TaxID=2662447 RepID=A0A6L5YZ00_9RHOB|nr:acyltransferase family protein [Halovulum marinum]MSU89092.1 acyltransferase family protein [Halovulum marinum]
MRYRADIDGLRAVAVAGVVLYHARVPWVQGGFAGVDVFFVISGYLIAGLFAAERARTGTVDLAAFARRRVRRLLPLLLLVLAVSLPVAAAVLLPQQLKDFGQAAGAAPLFAANLLFWHESGYFAATAAGKPLLHLWSLGVEGQFYLLAPLLLWRRAGLLAAGLLSLAAAVWAARALPEAGFYLTPFRLWEFLAGAALASWTLPRLPRAAGAAGLAMILATFAGFDGGMAWPGAAALLPVAGAALVIGAGGAPLLAAPPLVRLGQLSYGLYLWHWPVFVFFALRWPEAPWPLAAPGLLALSLALAWGSWHLVERPAARGAGGRLLPAAGLALVAAGVGLHLSGGLPARLPAEARAVLAQARVSSTPCHDRLDAAQAAAGARCVIGAPGVEPDLALIGDSHADHLGPALDRALAARGRAAVVYTGSWCAPVPGFGSAAPGRGPGCAALMQAAWAQVLADPKLRTVIAAAQWGNVTDGTRGDLPAVAYGSAALAASVPAANARALEAALQAFAPRLRAAGRQVLLPMPVPEFAAPVPDSLARLAWTGTATGVATGTATATLPPLDEAARNGAAAAVLRRFAAAAGARTVPVRDLFCAPGAARCRVRAADGAPLWRDASHLTPAGAAPVVARLMEIVDAGTATTGDHHDHLSLRQPPDTDRARVHLYR